ncbi:hypothetical protein [Corallococcus sp. AB045]|uniref:hypothetical protein n=1 Tax=Corallococcus sp. AB045 TaxID=2316719 RepID=UPI0011C3E314|nr:hypothetical protein [Corallococcus sp. AB045]
MNNTTDLFQFIACLPNLSERDFKSSVQEHALNNLQILDQTQPSARKEYKKRLSNRATHFKATVDRVNKRFRGKHGIAISSHNNEQHVRDFFHSAYYSAFFVARFALVSVGTHDCTGHAAIDNLLKQEVINRDPAKKAAAIALAQSLSEWREHRNLADYIMNETKISAIANPQIIDRIALDLGSHFSAWGVP